MLAMPKSWVKFPGNARNDTMNAMKVALDKRL